MRFINFQIIYMCYLACATKQPTDVGRGDFYSTDITYEVIYDHFLEHRGRIQ